MYNSVNLIGRLTDEPECVTTDGGKKLCHINLAVQRSYKNKDGIYEVDFIRCTLWEGIAQRVCEYTHKGDLISVSGKIKNTFYESENNEKKYFNDIIIEKVVFLASPNKNKKEIDS